MQDKIRELVERAIAQEGEGAIQVAVCLEGKCVVDVSAAPENVCLDERSLLPIFSTGKGIAATAVLRLVERGVLDLDAPIASYWPQFAANGKEHILLRHALNHTAGLPMLPLQEENISACDWRAMCVWLENQAPLHAPGAHRYYHAVTYSWLVGETASRADGRPFSQILHDEVLAPLSSGNLYIGVPEERLADCVNAEPLPVTDTPTPASVPNPVSARAIPEWIKPLETWINREDVRRACIPASNGFGTAREIARHYAALIGKGIDGVRLLSDETLDAATCWQHEVEGAIPGEGRWGLGYALHGPDAEPGARFGHGGYGGSTGLADRRSGFALGVVKSRLGGDLTKRILEIIDDHLQ